MLQTTLPFDVMWWYVLHHHCFLSSAAPHRRFRQGGRAHKYRNKTQTATHNQCQCQCIISRPIADRKNTSDCVSVCTLEIHRPNDAVATGLGASRQLLHWGHTLSDRRLRGLRDGRTTNRHPMCEGASALLTQNRHPSSSGVGGWAALTRPDAAPAVAAVAKGTIETVHNTSAQGDGTNC